LTAEGQVLGGLFTLAVDFGIEVHEIAPQQHRNTQHRDREIAQTVGRPGL
jgi:hypothetical protein